MTVEEFISGIREFVFEGNVYRVLCRVPSDRSKRSGVIVMHELLGVSPKVLDLAARIADEGYTVWVPVLFGPSHKTATKLEAAKGLFAACCLRREIHMFAADHSSPIAEMLRALCREFSQDVHASIGVVGLCLTGNFALAAITEASVQAAVCGQPSLPMPPLLGRRCALHLSPDEIRQIRTKTDAGFRMFGARFDGDWICPVERFDRLKKEFGNRAVIQPRIPGTGHAVFTEALSPDPEHPTHQALSEMIHYLRSRLA